MPSLNLLPLCALRISNCFRKKSLNVGNPAPDHAASIFSVSSLLLARIVASHSASGEPAGACR